jgi:hypothetical protein
MGRGKWRLYWFAYRKREGLILWDPEPQSYREELVAGRPWDGAQVRLEEEDGGRRVRIGVVRGDVDMELEGGLDVGQLSKDELETLLDDEDSEAETLAEERFMKYLEERHPGEKLASSLQSRQLGPSSPP